MRRNMLILVLLCCFSFFSAVIYSSQFTVGLPITLTNVQEPEIKEIVNLSEMASEQEAIRVIEDFYKAYTADFLYKLSSKDKVDTGKYLTDRLIDKISRLIIATGSDPIIRAQDFTETAFKTLKVGSLGNNWYMVSYRWNEREDGNNVDIPLKVTVIDGKYMIDYITPEWNGSLYGDSLLCAEMPEHPIGNTSPRAMLETFYEAYTSLYSSMPEGLLPRLEALRTAYLTPDALDQFNQASVNMYELDRVKNYDLLIDYFDFDCLWIPSITYTPLNENTFQVSYLKWGNLLTNVIITVIGFDGEYKIGSIRMEK